MQLSSLKVGEVISHGDLEFTKIRTGHGPLVITINGFMSENGKDHSDWASLLSAINPDSPWIHLNWPAGNVKKLLIGQDDDSKLKKIVNIAKTGAQIAAKRVHTVAPNLVLKAAKEWKQALDNAQVAGDQLGEFLSFSGDRGVILLGHSLGARVIHYALRRLPGSCTETCSAALLLGGAITQADSAWDPIFDKFKNLQLCNCYSHKDSVLTHLYKLGTLFTNSPCGLGRIEVTKSHNAHNFNLTSTVSGHMKYKTAAVGQELEKRFENIQAWRTLREELRDNVHELEQTKKNIRLEHDRFQMQVESLDLAQAGLQAEIDKL